MKLKILMVILLVTILVSACSANAPATALPTVVLDQGAAAQTKSPSVVSAGGSVAASGYVVAEQEAQMAFSLAGALSKVNVKVGDLVQPGQVLAELDSTMIQLEYMQAQRTLKELSSAAAQAAAAQALANARQNLEDAQDKVDGQDYRRASDTLIDNTQGEIDLAKQALARASDAYRQVARLPDGDNKKAAALVAMTNAQLRLNDLLARYNWYAGKPSEIDADLTSANLEAAKAAVQEAEWYLAALKGEQTPAEATGSNLARLAAAKDAVVAAKDRLDHTQLIAPIPGVIVAVNAVAGEMVSPGQVLFLISDVTRLHVETTDLSERDVPSVQVGQAVTISIKALNADVPGHVTLVSPVANTLGGDVVYKTKIEFDTPPEGLLAGMSVDVQYGE